MNSCWKCGRATPPNVTECERCESGGIEDQIEAALHQMDRDGIRFHAVDWDKVQTLADFKLICATLFVHYHIATNHPAYPLLKRFLK